MNQIHNPSIMKNITLIIPIIFTIASQSTAATTLIGNNIQVSRGYGSSTSSQNIIGAPVTVTVGPALELDDWYGAGTFDINLDGSTINIQFNSNLGANGSEPNFSFNGVTFTDIDGTINAFNGFSLISTTVSGFDSSFLSFDQNNLYVDLGGLTQSPGQNIELAVSIVPEPSSTFLAGLGALALASIRRRSR